MTKARLEAFSDRVVAILITIMVLELHTPHAATWGALSPLVPIFLTYMARARPAHRAADVRRQA